MTAATKKTTRTYLQLRELPHMDGPYRADGRCVLGQVEGAFGEVIANTIGPGQHANARRIAAALGAFSNLSTPTLESLARWGHMDPHRLRDTAPNSPDGAIAYILLCIRMELDKGNLYAAMVHAQAAVLEIRALRRDRDEEEQQQQ